MRGHALPVAMPLAAPAASGHGHLWQLPDGTGLHCPRGQLVEDPSTGRLCCHLCGRWYASLGAHVRVHGYTAAGYRQVFGLLTSRGLVAADLSAAVRARQQVAYDRHEAVRERLSEGQQLARTGQLAWRARVVARATEEPEQRLRQRRAALGAGRAAQQAARTQRLGAYLHDNGAQDLALHLRSAYTAGASLATLAAATGLGRAALRVALDQAGVVVRPSGVNTPQGRRSRALSADAEAARRLGVSDVQAWLCARHEEGWSLQQLARAVGHSSPWVRCRLPAGRLGSVAGEASRPAGAVAR